VCVLAERTSLCNTLDPQGTTMKIVAGLWVGSPQFAAGSLESSGPDCSLSSAPLPLGRWVKLIWRGQAKSATCWDQ